MVEGTDIFETVSLPSFVTQMFAPSKVKYRGAVPTARTPRTVPSLALSCVTVLPSWSAIQMFAPSKTRPHGPDPAGKVPRSAPSLARNFVTVLSPLFGYPNIRTVENYSPR